ncbi:MAG: hypothetical protein K8J31_02200 [Anaerolineae bacterium]|nr:hypothetical protein [Anaerolineae bacterium]
MLGARVQRTAEEFRAVLDSPQQMAADLWQHVPQTLLEQIEQRMYTCAREQMLVYLDESAVEQQARDD